MGDVEYGVVGVASACGEGTVVVVEGGTSIFVGWGCEYLDC